MCYYIITLSLLFHKKHFNVAHILSTKYPVGCFNLQKLLELTIKSVCVVDLQGLSTTERKCRSL